MATSNMDPKNCDFCKIAQGGNPNVEVICEGETWIAFFPLNPATPGHTLIISRNHISDLWTASWAPAAAPGSRPPARSQNKVYFTCIYTLCHDGAKTALVTFGQPAGNMKIRNLKTSRIVFAQRAGARFS